MISPLLNTTIKGAVWYQGESNGGAPVPYGCQQPALVADWRSKWHAASQGQTDSDFPFGIVQIAPVINDPDPIQPTAIRWFQTGSPPAQSGKEPTARGGSNPNPNPNPNPTVTLVLTLTLTLTGRLPPQRFDAQHLFGRHDRPWGCHLPLRIRPL